MAKRPCLTCGVPTTGTRCPTHKAELKAVRNAHAPAARHLVAEWIEQHGYWCPGWRRPPHSSTDLTADHAIPLAAGSNEPPTGVLCRSCNSSKRDHLD